MRPGRNRAGMTTGMLLGGAVVLLALPSAVLAFATGFETDGLSRSAGRSTSDLASTPGAAGLVPAAALRSLGKGPLYPFTPAGTPNRPERSVTVAVRVDPDTAREISVQGTRLARVETAQPTPVRIAASAFNLGVSRGYASFAQGLVPPDDRSVSGLVGGIEKQDALAAANPRIALDDGRPAGRSPRTFASESGRKLDLGGSYRVTGNLNVTTGVRYSQDRERLRPLTDGNLDNQAVYVGTQFRF